MKVIHLSHADGGAGAGRAAYRIHTALRGLGVDSHMLVSQKRTADPTVQAIFGSSLEGWGVHVAEYLEARAGRALSRDASTFLSPARYGYFQPAHASVVRNADVVTAYWINGAFIRPESLAAINKPLVWRLSDAWPFTGGCHYPGTCDHFERQCGDCPQMRKPGPKDASYHLWLRKQHAWRALDLTVVAPSNWMAGLARSSALFADRLIEVVPTGVDLERYRPCDRSAARASWGLSQDRLLILFGAMSPTDDVRKGYRELRRALEVVAQSSLASHIQVVMFGSDAPQPADLFPVPILSLGHLEGDEALAATYNCADLVVVPSLEDNLPNVALEAIACGVPVVAFDVCGMSDIVTDGWNGRLIPQVDSESMGRVLVEMLSDVKKLLAMRLNARQRAQQRFSLKDQAKTYLALYEQIVVERRIKRSRSLTSWGLN